MILEDDASSPSPATPPPNAVKSYNHNSSSSGNNPTASTNGSMIHAFTSATEVYHPVSALALPSEGSALFEDLEIAPRNRERNRTQSLVSHKPWPSAMVRHHQSMGSGSGGGIAFTADEYDEYDGHDSSSSGFDDHHTHVVDHHHHRYPPRQERSFTIDPANAQVYARQQQQQQQQQQPQPQPLSSSSAAAVNTSSDTHSMFSDDLSHISHSSFSMLDAHSHPNSLLNLSQGDASFFAGLDPTEQDKMLMELACAKVHFATASYELELERLAKRKKSAKLRQEQKELERRLQRMQTTTSASSSSSASASSASPSGQSPGRRNASSTSKAAVSSLSPTSPTRQPQQQSQQQQQQRMRSPSVQETFHHLITAASDMFSGLGTTSHTNTTRPNSPSPGKKQRTTSPMKTSQTGHQLRGSR